MRLDSGYKLLILLMIHEKYVSNAQNDAFHATTSDYVAHTMTVNVVMSVVNLMPF